MRLLIVSMLLALSGPAFASDVEILAATPASVELTGWCRSVDDGACRQEIADVAQGRCQGVGRSAQYVRATLIERSLFRGEKSLFVYSCVR